MSLDRNILGVPQKFKADATADTPQTNQRVDPFQDAEETEARRSRNLSLDLD